MPSRLSTVFWKVPVSGTVDGATIDITADSVYIAVLASASAEPTDQDWKLATWEALGGGRYAARILVGPAGGDLNFATTVTGPTRMYVWVKVIDSRELPVINAGPMLVT